MPVIGISVKHLNKLLGREIASEELAQTLERLGCDLEGVGESVFYECSACHSFIEKMEHEEAPRHCNFCGFEAETSFDKRDSDQVIRLDLLPARPDLFDAGGLARAIKGYLGIETGLREFEVTPPKVVVKVDAALSNAESYRPFIACAIVEMPVIEADSLRALMKLQENLHWGIGRDRKLASIGIYDLRTVEPPITYKAAETDYIFMPLGNPDQSMTLTQILEEHPKGKAYAHLLKDFTKYPLLIDSVGQVLSMPPIINSDETKVKEGSTRLFIDVTGTTQRDVDKSLNTLVSSLVEMGGKVEAVEMTFADKKITTPNLALEEITVNIEFARRWLGIALPLPDFIAYLEKMRFAVSGRFPYYQVKYPAFRTDIKHEVDIFEDLIIAHGYHNINMQLVPTMTVGEPRAEEEISQIARQIMLGLGFVEIMSLMLVTKATHFTKLRREPTKKHAIIANPKSVEHNIVRTHLFTGIMESLTKNRRKQTPQRYFELGNVVFVKEGKESEERHLAFAIIGPETGYAEIRSILDAILHEFGWNADYTAAKNATFIEGRTAAVSGENVAGIIGEVHPEVLNNFGIAYPVAMGEICLAKIESTTTSKF